MINLRAYIGNEQLKLVNGRELQVIFKSKPSTDFIPFYGQPREFGMVNWKPAIDRPDARTSNVLGRMECGDDMSLLTGATGIGDTAVSITIDRLNWINCDRFLNDTTAIFVHYQIRPENTTMEHLNAFNIFDKINGILPLHSLNSGSLEFEAKLPTGSTAKILVLGSKGNQLYMGLKQAGLFQSKDSIKLQLTDEKKVQAAIDDFN